MSQSKLLTIQAITFERDGQSVLKKISFNMKAGQRVAIAGETGSGKSTLLKIMAGLEQPTGGEVRFNDVPVKGPVDQLVPGHPHIVYLSQHFELPKFLRVEQILEYANKLTPASANKIFSICHIKHLMQRKTHELSGGEKQRIAIARLLIQQPQLLLLDEPFSHLDIQLKKILKHVVDDIGAKLKISCILVSHDPADTLPWADDIIILKNGHVVQQGTPKNIYRTPKNEYVAGLFGHYTLLNGAWLRKLNIKTKAKKIFLRPEEIYITQKSRKSFPATITGVQYLGHSVLLSAESNKKNFFFRTVETDLAIGQQIFMRATRSA